MKIGINSGPAIIGNVGTEQRHNYTAVGETVNIAARLESVPGHYGCGLVIGGTTAEMVADSHLVCQLDRLQVRGKTEAISVYQVLCPRAAAEQAELSYVSAYSRALNAYRSRDFGRAAAWRSLGLDRPEFGAAPLFMAELSEKRAVSG